MDAAAMRLATYGTERLMPTSRCFILASKFPRARHQQRFNNHRARRLPAELRAMVSKARYRRYSRA